MKAKIIVYIAISVASLSSFGGFASAHLGESKKQLTADYGPPTSSQEDSSADHILTFESPGRLMIACFRDEKCISITITAIGGDFTEAEVRDILTQNAQGFKWVHAKDDGDLWMRGDGAVAFITVGSVDILAPAAVAPREPDEEPVQQRVPQPNTIVSAGGGRTSDAK
jgi:hypothetical protein